MTALDRIRLKGFRNWYEHQLMESHAWFFTCFVCLILIVSALEASNTQGFNKTAMIILALVSTAGFVFSWRSYKRLLDEAEHMAELATCPACGTYGVFRVVASGGDKDAEASEEMRGQWFRAHCKHCQHEWHIG